MRAQKLRIAHITKPHGVRGAVKAEILGDDSSRFRGLNHGLIERHGEYTPVRLVVQSISPSGVILSIDGCTTVEAAETYRGTFLCVERSEAVSLPDGSYFVEELIGCTAYGNDGKVYGRVTDVLQLPANDVYVIEGGKLMVPALKRVLDSVEVENNRIVFDAKVLEEVGLFED